MSSRSTVATASKATLAGAAALTMAAGLGLVQPSAAQAAAPSCGKDHIHCSMTFAKQVRHGLRLGDRGSEVKALQISLQHLGYRIPATGFFGPSTLAALKNYQYNRKIMPVTGNFDARTSAFMVAGAGNYMHSLKYLPVAKPVVKKAAPKAAAKSAGVTSSVSTTGVGGSCAASFYGDPQMTASGEQFNPSALTAASKTLPFNTRVLVTNRSNGKSVVVRINDRGPYVSGRCLDLSTAAFSQIASTGAGVANVSWAVVR